MRKNDHIKYALEQAQSTNDFERIRFIHSSLPNISLDDVNLSTSFCGFDFNYPIYINAMTGGTEESYIINDKLSQLANYFNLPMASGSLSIAIKNPQTKQSFEVIRNNLPNGIVIANIGADKTIVEANKAIEILDADILQIHLNVVQEMIMPEGDRNFVNLKENIINIKNNVNIPVIVKEVGFGMDRKTLEKLKKLGIKTIDISGKGGTNFALIENKRRKIPFDTLNDFGLTTVESLLEANIVSNLEILASGGIMTPMDVVKALALGSKAVGMAGYFLRLVTENSLSDAIKKFEHFILEVKTIMTILNAKKIDELKTKELIFDQYLLNFIKQRKIHMDILNKR